jgi:TfoX N-terminal domain
VDAQHHLAQRIRDVISARPDVVEKRMFGGLAFMLRGNMAVCAGGTGTMLVRVEPEEVETLVREPGVATFGRMGAKPMKGFVEVNAEDLSDAAFAAWVNRGAERALSLPPK